MHIREYLPTIFLFFFCLLFLFFYWYNSMHKQEKIQGNPYRSYTNISSITTSCIGMYVRLCAMSVGFINVPLHYYCQTVTSVMFFNMASLKCRRKMYSFAVHRRVTWVTAKGNLLTNTSFEINVICLRYSRFVKIH